MQGHAQQQREAAHGVERMRWKSFCELIVRLASLAGVNDIVTLGALLADSPHTRPVPLTGSASDPRVMAKEIATIDVAFERFDSASPVW